MLMWPSSSTGVSFEPSPAQLARPTFILRRSGHRVSFRNVVIRHQARAIKNAIVASLLVASFLVSAVAGAADPAEVEDLIAHGVEFRRAGNDHRALPLFKKAYDLSPTPRTAAQLGLVEMALGYRIDSEQHLAESLAAPRDPWIHKNREILERSLRQVRAGIGEVAIAGSPAGAEVSVNGTIAGRLPLKAPVRVGEGPAIIEVRAPGYITERQTVPVTGEKREDVAIRLRPVEAAPPPTPTTLPPIAQAPAKAAPPSPPTPATPPRRLTPPPSPDLSAPKAHPIDSADEERPAEVQPSTRRTGAARRSGDSDNGGVRALAWVTAGAAAAGLGFGAYQTFQWRDKLNQFDTTTRPSIADTRVQVKACGADDPGRGTLPICGTLYSQLNDAKTLAIVGYAVGGGLAIGSVILFLASSSTTSSEPDRRESFACVPGEALRGIVCRIAF
jgi:hypothetical protein